MVPGPAGVSWKVLIVVVANAACACGCEGSNPPSDTPARASSPASAADPAAVNETVHSRDRQIRVCYLAGLKRNPTLGAGEVRIRFTIDDRGRAVAVEDAGSQLRDRAVVACIVREFEALRFAPPERGTPTLVYPLVLGAGDAHP